MTQANFIDGVERQAVNMRPVSLSCGDCGNDGQGYAYPSGQHLRLDCAACGRYVKFLSHEDAFAVGYGFPQPVAEDDLPW